MYRVFVFKQCVSARYSLNKRVHVCEDSLQHDPDVCSVWIKLGSSLCSVAETTACGS